MIHNLSSFLLSFPSLSSLPSFPLQDTVSSVSRPFIQVPQRFSLSTPAGTESLYSEKLKECCLTRPVPFWLYGSWNHHSVLFSSAQCCTIVPVKQIPWSILAAYRTSQAIINLTKTLVVYASLHLALDKPALAHSLCGCRSGHISSHF